MNFIFIVVLVIFAALVIGLLLLKFSKPKKQVVTSGLHDEKIKSEIIINSIQDGVILIDEQKVIQLFNPGASRITGWETKESVGLDYHSVLKIIDEKGESYDDSKNPISIAFEKGNSAKDNKAILITKSNKQVAVNINVSPLVDEQNNVNGVVGIFRDVSEERSEEKQRAEFISTASHEMRTPVAAIEGYLALALNDKVSKIDDKARGYLQKAHDSTQSLGKLFQDLLTSAKAEDGRLSNHPVILEMGEYLEKLSSDLKFAADKKNLQTEFIIGTTDSTIDASSDNNKVVRPFYYTKVDPDRLREVITNLFDNAVKYTDTGKISLGITGNQEVVQIYVKDTGHGITPEDIPHLFQKFYRVDTSATRADGGTGLGLFICKKIVELYSGHIWVESQVNKGSTFYINLPRVSSNSLAQNTIQPNSPNLESNFDNFENNS